MRLAWLLLFPPVFFLGAAEAQQPPSGREDLTGPLQVFDPAHQKPLSYSDRAVQITLVAGPQGQSLRIRNSKTKEEKTVPLPQELAQADEIRAARNGNLVVRGMVNGAVSEIAIINIIKLTIYDKFVCYLPSISPDGQYVAFIKFYPAHFSNGAEDHYMLYDLGKSPSLNRPAHVPPDDWQNVGRAIYPIGVGNRPGDTTGIPEDARHGSASRLFWIPNGRELFFADRVNSRGQIELLLADIGAEGDVTMRRAEQEVGPLCSILKDPAVAQSCSLLVREAEFHPGPAPSFTVTFEVVALRRLVPLHLGFSEFRPSA